MFELGKVYRRRDLHDEFGGQRQGGIVTPAGRPFIFLITGEGGEDFGYRDEQRPDGSFVYYGEGQEGPMEFVRGNLAVRDHAAAGRDLYIFRKVPPAHLRYLGQYLCAGYELVPEVPDGNDLVEERHRSVPPPLPELSPAGVEPRGNEFLRCLLSPPCEVEHEYNLRLHSSATIAKHFAEWA